jgi:hypothetical protein
LLCFSNTGNVASITLLPDTAAAALSSPLSKLQAAAEKLQLEHQASKAITRVQLDPQGYLGEYMPGLSSMINEPEEEEEAPGGNSTGLGEQQQQGETAVPSSQEHEDMGEYVKRRGPSDGSLGTARNAAAAAAAMDRSLSTASTVLVPDDVLPSRLLQCGLSQVHSHMWQLHVKPSLEGLTGLGPVVRGVMEGAAGGSSGDITRGMAPGESPPEVQPLECSGWAIDGNLAGEVLEWLRSRGGVASDGGTCSTLDGESGGAGVTGSHSSQQAGCTVCPEESGLQDVAQRVFSAWRCLDMTCM